MPSDTDAPAEPGAYQNIGLRADWSERTVAAVATGFGVLIVALIAVLMGMT